MHCELYSTPCLIAPEMKILFYDPHWDKPTSHNDGVIYTPGVFVFKVDDYVEFPVEKRFSVDVITCAAPNLRPSTNNKYNKETGGKLDITPGELYNLHVKRQCHYERCGSQWHGCHHPRRFR